jgi:hypothetical protein
MITIDEEDREEFVNLMTEFKKKAIKAIIWTAILAYIAGSIATYFIFVK